MTSISFFLLRLLHCFALPLRSKCVDGGMVDAPDLGSGEFLVWVQVPLHVFLFSLLIFSIMKPSMLTNKRLYPLPVRQKQTCQQGNPLRKLTLKQKGFYRKNTRVFSLEYSRYLQKRILWKILTKRTNSTKIQHHSLQSKGSSFGALLHKTVDTQQPRKGLSIAKTLLLGKFKEINFRSTKNETLLKKVQACLLKTQQKKFLKESKKHYKMLNWGKNQVAKNQDLTTKFKTFHAMVLTKKWQFDNASIVPGMVWPLKSKRVLVAKMRAFKTLSHLIQARNLKQVIQMLQKLWNSQNITKPSVWSLVGGIDSLKNQVLLKSGLVASVGAVRQHPKAFAFNGSESNKKHMFYYPGDLICSQSQPSEIFGELFSTGPKTVFVKNAKRNLGLGRKNFRTSRYPCSIYSNKPFQWLANFYQNGYLFKKSPKLTKQRLKKRF